MRNIVGLRLLWALGWGLPPAIARMRLVGAFILLRAVSAFGTIWLALILWMAPQELGYLPNFMSVILCACCLPWLILARYQARFLRETPHQIISGTLFATRDLPRHPSLRIICFGQTAESARWYLMVASKLPEQDLLTSLTLGSANQSVVGCNSTLFADLIEENAEIADLMEVFRKAHFGWGAQLKHNLIVGITLIGSGALFEGLLILAIMKVGVPFPRMHSSDLFGLTLVVMLSLLIFLLMVQGLRTIIFVVRHRQTHIVTTRGQVRVILASGYVLKIITPTEMRYLLPGMFVRDIHDIETHEGLLYEVRSAEPIGAIVSLSLISEPA